MYLSVGLKGRIGNDVEEEESEEEMYKGQAGGEKETADP